MYPDLVKTAPIRTLLLLVALLPLPAALAGGKGPHPCAQRERENPPPKSSPEALALLEKAIAHQGPEKYAVEGAIENLTVKIAAQAYDHSKKPPEKISLDVRRYLATEPTRFRTEWATAAGVEVYGHDGKRSWAASYDTNGMLVSSKFLFGDDDALTRQKIHAEIAETQHLLRLFFLANLKQRPAAFLTLDDETVKVGKTEHRCRVVRRVGTDSARPEPPLTLWLDAKTATLVKARVEATREGQKSLIFLFRYDEDYQPRVKGVLFPFRIEIREQAFGAKEDRLMSTATIKEDGGIAFNTALDGELFKRPKEPK
ncbi:MAG: hypothetical protein ACYTDY_10820 [Planctomycetota bacterium]|jgi:hypothetical protein